MADPEAAKDVAFPRDMVKGKGIETLIEEEGEAEVEPEENGSLHGLSFIGREMLFDCHTLAQISRGRCSTAYPTSDPNHDMLYKTQ